MEKLANFIIRYRTAIIIILIGVTIFMGIQIKNARFNPDMMTYLPEDMPSRVNQKKIEDIFGGTEMIMLVLKTDDVINTKTLKRIEKLSHEMKRIKGIEKVMSLFDLKQVRSENDVMIVDPAVKMIPQTKEEIESIKREITENDLVYGSVISIDFTTTAVIGMLEPGTPDKVVVEQVENLIKKYPGEEETLLGGSPYMRVQTATNMLRDMVRLLPLGIFFMLLFLYLSFRQFRAVWLSSLVVFMSIFIALGLIPLLNWDFTVVTIILPVMLIAVANDYAIHMFAHYQYENTIGNSLSKEEISKSMIRHLGKPILIAGITTIAGLLCMLGHILIPAGQMGILGGLGIGYAIIASLFFIPALNSFLNKTKPIIREKHFNEKGLDGILLLMNNLVTKKPKQVIIVLSAITILISLGLFRLSVNTNSAELYPEGHPVKKSAELINSKLGGFLPLAVVFEGNIKNPNLLKKIDQLEKRIKEIPEVGTTQSIAKVTRQISRALNNPGDSLYNRIPETYNAASQYFELYLMSGDPEDLEKMVDFSFNKAMLLIRFKDLNTPIIRKCVKEIKAMVKDDPDVKLVGGNSDVFSEMDKQIVYGQFKSLVLSLLVIFIVIALSFRSIKGSLLQITPLLLAILLLFGIMGFAGIELNFTTALISSIMIGVGIDYTTHFIWHYREKLKSGLEIPEAIKLTIYTTGRGIIFNALSVIIGFAALLFSSFMPVRFFGLLMIIIIFTCLIGGLILIPALCVVVKPKFLEPETNKEIPDGLFEVNRTEDSFEQV